MEIRGKFMRKIILLLTISIIFMPMSYGKPKRIQNKRKIEKIKKHHFYLKKLKTPKEIDNMDLKEMHQYLKTITKILKELLKE